MAAVISELHQNRADEGRSMLPAQPTSALLDTALAAVSSTAAVTNAATTRLYSCAVKMKATAKTSNDAYGCRLSLIHI